MRKTGDQEMIGKSLLASTAFCRRTQFTQAWTDLDKAWEIAEYGSMRLHITDYYLEAARNIKAQLATFPTADESPCKILEEGEEIALSKAQMVKHYLLYIDKTEQLINDIGYCRSDDGVTEL